MSFNQNTRTFFGAIITLATACIISASAQTPAAVNSLTSKTDSLQATRETALEKKYARPTKDSDLTSRSGAKIEVNSPSDAADPVPASADTKTAVPVVDEERGETGTATTSPQQSASGTWQFQLTPYIWIPTISGRAGIGNLTTDTSASVGDSDIELNFGVMGTFEARKDKFIILTDLQYSDLATERNNRGPLYSSTRSSFKTFVLDPEVGYRFFDNGNGATLDVLGGIRYWNLDATLAFRAGLLPAVEVSRSRSWVDAVAGLRGKAALSQRFFVTGKADLGAGGSKFTYQLFGGLGINLGKRVALVAGYRDLNVNYDKDNFLFDMSLHGPIFGIGFKF